MRHLLALFQPVDSTWTAALNLGLGLAITGLIVGFFIAGFACGLVSHAL